MSPTTALLLIAALSGQVPPGTIETLAGSGRSGSSGNGGSALAATLREPFGCELDGRGGLLVADAADGRVRRVDLGSGIIAAVAGDGRQGLGGEGQPASEAPVGTPYAVAAGRNGDLYIVDQKTPVVRKFDGQSGIMTVFAGTGAKGFSGDGGPASAATLREPNDCCLDGRGGVLIADVADWRVRRVDLASGVITTFAGTGKPPKKHARNAIGDGGPATAAVVVGARAVCVDAKGNTYICEREGNAVRKVDALGLISTIAGTGLEGYSGDGGLASLASFRGPKGIRADLSGNLYVVDTENHAIRRIDALTGQISTVAGGRRGSGGDGGNATGAGLDRPHGCIVGPDGTLYIADGGNHRVRRVTPR